MAITLTPRVDKTDSAVGVVRAVLATAFAVEDLDKVIPVGLNASGRVVKGAGTSGVIGVVILSKYTNVVGLPVDVFKLGDIVDIAGLAAGKKYFATAAGAIVDVATDNTYVGFTVEADRLVLAGF